VVDLVEAVVVKYSIMKTTVIASSFTITFASYAWTEVVDQVGAGAQRFANISRGTDVNIFNSYYYRELTDYTFFSAIVCDIAPSNSDFVNDAQMSGVDKSVSMFGFTWNKFPSQQVLTASSEKYIDGDYMFGSNFILNSAIGCLGCYDASEFIDNLYLYEADPKNNEYELLPHICPSYGIWSQQQTLVSNKNAILNHLNSDGKCSYQQTCYDINIDLFCNSFLLDDIGGGVIAIDFSNKHLSSSCDTVKMEDQFTDRLVNYSHLQNGNPESCVESILPVDTPYIKTSTNNLTRDKGQKPYIGDCDIWFALLIVAILIQLWNNISSSIKQKQKNTLSKYIVEVLCIMIISTCTLSLGVNGTTSSPTKSPTSMPTVTPTRSPTSMPTYFYYCPSPFSVYQSGATCYYKTTALATWDVAKSTCATYGAKLVTKYIYILNIWHGLDRLQ
jgi:hypothetical protein